MMTKNDFETIARALRRSKPDIRDFTIRDQWNKDVRTISAACKFLNPRFDSEKFFEACNL